MGWSWGFFPAKELGGWDRWRSDGLWMGCHAYIEYIPRDEKFGHGNTGEGLRPWWKRGRVCRRTYLVVLDGLYLYRCRWPTMSGQLSMERQYFFWTYSSTLGCEMPYSITKAHRLSFNLILTSSLPFCSRGDIPN